mmetsp:Transcript_3474/g.8344  ORF Transcript_3474/g.8344 Transcript_3474/m.8344 type:complete len:283 (-) Transcript_3474:3431-4279(-)
MARALVKVAMGLREHFRSERSSASSSSSSSLSSFSPSTLGNSLEVAAVSVSAELTVSPTDAATAIASAPGGRNSGASADILARFFELSTCSSATLSSAGCTSSGCLSVCSGVSRFVPREPRVLVLGTATASAGAALLSAVCASVAVSIESAAGALASAAAVTAIATAGESEAAAAFCALSALRRSRSARICSMLRAALVGSCELALVGADNGLEALLDSWTGDGDGDGDTAVAEDADAAEDAVSERGVAAAATAGELLLLLPRAGVDGEALGVAPVAATLLT